MKRINTSRAIVALAVILILPTFSVTAFADPTDQSSASDIMASLDAAAPEPEPEPDESDHMVFDESEIADTAQETEGSGHMVFDETEVADTSVVATASDINESPQSSSSAGEAPNVVCDAKTGCGATADPVPALQAASAAVSRSATGAERSTPKRSFDLAFDLDDGSAAFRTND